MKHVTLISFPLDVRDFSLADSDSLKFNGDPWWSYRIQSGEIQFMFNSKTKLYKIEKYPTKWNAITL